MDIICPAESSEAFSVDQDESSVIGVGAHKHRDLVSDHKYLYYVDSRLKIVTAIFSRRKDIEGTRILSGNKKELVCTSE